MFFLSLLLVHVSKVSCYAIRTVGFCNEKFFILTGIISFSLNNVEIETNGRWKNGRRVGGLTGHVHETCKSRESVGQ